MWRSRHHHLTPNVPHDAPSGEAAAAAASRRRAAKPLPGFLEGSRSRGLEGGARGPPAPHPPAVVGVSRLRRALTRGSGTCLCG